MHIDGEGVPVLHPNAALKAIAEFKQPTYTIVNCAEDPGKEAWALFLSDGKDGPRVSLISGLDPYLYWVFKWLSDNDMPVAGIQILVESGERA